MLQTCCSRPKRLTPTVAMIHESTVRGLLLDFRFLNRTHSPVNAHSRIKHNKHEQKISDVSSSCIMLVGSILVSHSASSLALAEMIDPYYVQSTWCNWFFCATQKCLTLVLLVSAAAWCLEWWLECSWRCQGSPISKGMRPILSWLHDFVVWWWASISAN